MWLAIVLVISGCSGGEYRLHSLPTQGSTQNVSCYNGYPRCVVTFAKGEGLAFLSNNEAYEFGGSANDSSGRKFHVLDDKPTTLYIETERRFFVTNGGSGEVILSDNQKITPTTVLFSPSRCYVGLEPKFSIGANSPPENGIVCFVFRYDRKIDSNSKFSFYVGDMLNGDKLMLDIGPTQIFLKSRGF
jgi:hypothetical protein